MFRSRRAVRIAGIVASALGVLWALQGAGFVQGSVMSNDPTWVWIGSLTAVGGAAVAFLASRSPR